MVPPPWPRYALCTLAAVQSGTASGPNPTAWQRKSHPSKRRTPHCSSSSPQGQRLLPWTILRLPLARGRKPGYESPKKVRRSRTTWMAYLQARKPEQYQRQLELKRQRQAARKLRSLNVEFLPVISKRERHCDLLRMPLAIPLTGRHQADCRLARSREVEMGGDRHSGYCAKGI